MFVSEVWVLIHMLVAAADFLQAVNDTLLTFIMEVVKTK